MNLPSSLNRKAVKQAFPRVSEAKWDNLFDYEKHNGLYAIRVQGPDKYPYYDVEKLMAWLIQRSLYRRSDFQEPGELFYEGPRYAVKRHALAG